MLGHDGTTPEWVEDAIHDLEATLTSKDPRFPCLYALRALHRGTLRYTAAAGFDEVALDGVARSLRAYVQEAPTLGDLSSLLVIFRPDGMEADLADHTQRFWDVLTGLHHRDEDPWPASMPTDPDESVWEFCFSGEALFVFGSSPAHSQRKSRNSSNFMMAFQPRFMFDRLLANPVQLAHAMRIIRRRLRAFDGLVAHPDLGLYPDPGTREWKQYMLPDSNEERAGRCPLEIGRRPQADSVSRAQR